MTRPNGSVSWQLTSLQTRLTSSGICRGFTLTHPPIGLVRAIRQYQAPLDGQGVFLVDWSRRRRYGYGQEPDILK
jgi:hypothetical protein